MSLKGTLSNEFWYRDSVQSSYGWMVPRSRCPVSNIAILPHWREAAFLVATLSASAVFPF